MASTNSTVDGMGFEEMNQSQEQPSNIWITGSVIAGEKIASAGDISGGQFIYGASVLADQSIQIDSNELRSNAIQNATYTYGYKMRAGSVKIGDSSSGLISFLSPGRFVNANYHIVLTPRDWTLPIANTAGSITGFCISGTRRASGCWAYGPSGTVADWIAMGI